MAMTMQVVARVMVRANRRPEDFVIAKDAGDDGEQ